MKDVEFRHVIRPESGNPFTFAFFKDENGDYFVGVSVCSNKDQYSRPMGRRVALQRLNSFLKAAKEGKHLLQDAKVHVFVPNFSQNHRRYNWSETLTNVSFEINRTISKREEAKNKKGN